MIPIFDQVAVAFFVVVGTFVALVALGHIEIKVNHNKEENKKENKEGL